MATGRRLVINADNGGWACFRNRNNGSERHNCSDRMKGIRRAITKKCRTALKRDVQNILKDLD